MNTQFFFYLDGGSDDDYKKKTRRNRTTFSNNQLAALEKVIKGQNKIKVVHKTVSQVCNLARGSKYEIKEQKITPPLY